MPSAASFGAVVADLLTPLDASPALEDRLARLRRDGGAARAGALASRAARALEQVAARELDGGDVDAGVAHYKIALTVDPAAPGTSQLAATLRERAEAALRAGRATLAVRWARTVVGLAEADPAAHALLAEALSASHEDAAAVAEFDKALASRPADAALRRGLARARRRVALAAAPHPRAKAGAATRDPAAAETAPAAIGEDSEDDAEKAPPRSESSSEPKPAQKSGGRSAPGSAAGEATPEQ